MIRRSICIIIGILSFAYYPLSGQNIHRQIQHASFVLTKDTTLFFNNTIVPSSVKVNAAEVVKDLEYEINNDALLIYAQPTAVAIEIELRTLKYDLGNYTGGIGASDYTQKDQLIRIESDYSQDELAQRRFIQSNKLEYDGSFSRGINFGNTQDLVLNSDFNLQMKGDLGNGLFVRAAISDDNIPVQPEGNTQVLQEFDKVFIEIQKDRTRLIAGDYELARPKSYFMNYYKKLKGFSAQNISSAGKWQIENQGSFAISRGKFKRLMLETTEGNQGPYRLEGEDGDLFLQVLSGTEKVFVDGRLLTRGENHDYVIDYNRAEIRFTANLIITSYTRIIIEYEFATQNYVRSLYATKSSISNEKFRFSLNLYNEQDSRRLAANLSLDSTDLNVLRESGDGRALRSGLFRPENGDFSNTTPYLLAEDTLSYAPNFDPNNENIVGARFSNFGANQGSYLIDASASTNGRVYKYVGAGQGNYDPFVQLIAPEKKQLLTLGGSYTPTVNTKIHLETALSQNDLNRFSDIDNSDNQGHAINLSLNHKQALNSIFSKGDSMGELQFFTKADSEIKFKNFKALNPYRAAEFSRDWNFRNDTINTDEQLTNIEIGIANNDLSLSQAFGYFNAKDFYSGIRHFTKFKFNKNSWKVDGELKLLNSESSFESTSFLRPNFRIYKNIFSLLDIGFRYEKEKNVRNLNIDNSLRDISFNFDIYTVSFGISEENPLFFNSSISKRIDDQVKDQVLSRATESYDYSLGGGWNYKSNSNLRWNFTLRDFKVTELFEDSNTPKKTLIGLIDHNLSLFNSGLVVSSYLESDSGQEPKIEFQFVQVGRGEGSYFWQDANGDEEMQLYEFQIDPTPEDANFVKVSVFNNEFVSTNKTIVNQSIRLNPKKFISNKKSWINRFQWSSRYRIDQRALNVQDSKFFEWPGGEVDSLISLNSSSDHNLFFNRGSASFDSQLAYRNLDNQIQQVIGKERRSNKEIYTRSRLNLVKALDFILEGASVKEGYILQINEALNYDISGWWLKPQINYRPSNKLRIIGSFKYEKGANRINGLEQANTQDFGLECTWRKTVKSNLQLRTNLVRISYDQNENTPVALALLNGLRNGTNYLLNLNYTRRVGKNFDLILNINLRKSEGADLVNTAGVQLRANF